MLLLTLALTLPAADMDVRLGTDVDTDVRVALALAAATRPAMAANRTPDCTCSGSSYDDCRCFHGGICQCGAKSANGLTWHEHQGGYWGLYRKAISWDGSTDVLMGVYLPSKKLYWALLGGAWDTAQRSLPAGAPPAPRQDIPYTRCSLACSCGCIEGTNPCTCTTPQVRVRQVEGVTRTPLSPAYSSPLAYPQMMPAPSHSPFAPMQSFGSFAAPGCAGGT